MADDATIDPSSVHDVQVARLDADMFSADDIDGTNEGLVGSGNLNYLVLQSSQTNEAGMNTNPFEVMANGDPSFGSVPAVLSGLPAGLSDSRAINPSDFSKGESSSGFLSSNSSHNDNGIFNNSDTSNNSNNNNSITALNSATHSSFSSSSNASESSEVTNNYPGDDGNNGLNGNNGSGNSGLNGNNGNNGSGNNGTSGNNGSNGHDGIDGHSPVIPPDVPIDSHIAIHVVSDILNSNLDLLANPIGNLVGGLNVDVTAILGNILLPDDGLLPHPGAIIDGIIGGNHILNDAGIGPLLVTTEHAVDNLVGHVNTIATDLLPGVPNVLGTVGGVLNHLNGDNGLFVTSDLKLPFVGGLGGVGDLAAHVPLTAVENILGVNNIHLSLNTDQSGLFSDGSLHLNSIEIGLTSTGGILPGLNTGITTNDLLGSTVSTAQDVLLTLTQNHDIIGNLVPDAAHILPNTVDQITNILNPVTDALQTITSGDILGTINTGEVAAAVHDALGYIPLEQIPGGAMLESGINSLVGQVTDGITPVTDGLTDVLHQATDPLSGVIGGLGGDQLTDNLTDTLHGVVDNIPVGDVTDAVTGLTAPVADLVHDLAGSNIGDLDTILDPTQLPETLQDIVAGLGGSGNDPLGGLTEILSPVTDALHNLGGGDLGNLCDVPNPGQLPDTLQDVVGGFTVGGTDNPVGYLLGGLAGGGTSGNDTDLTVHTGIDIVDNTLNLPDIAVTLDPVENIVGDIDLGVNLDTNVVNQVLSGDVQGTINSLVNTASNAVDLNLGLFNLEPDQNAGLGLPLGNTGTNAVGDILSTLTSSASGASSWPEATVGGAVDTLTSTLGDTHGATLPDPVGIITEGLNLVHDTGGGGSSSGGGLLGGLLGGSGGHHGLFG